VVSVLLLGEAGQGALARLLQRTPRRLIGNGWSGGTAAGQQEKFSVCALPDACFTQ
jgi:hypothetical protein